MAQAIIYANGETSGSSFHLVSEWRCTTGSNGTLQITNGPTTGSATYSYSLASQPSGAKLNKVTVFARVGARFMPNSGISNGYPKANGIQLTVVDSAADPYLRSAELTFEDTSVTTKVTYSFRAAGSTSSQGNHSGSVSFDDVYLVVDYTPPNSDWTIDTDSVEAGNTLSGNIVLTEDNTDYSHRVIVRIGDAEVYSDTLPAGQDAFSIAVPLDWIAYFPNSENGTAYLTVETIASDGTVLGISEPVEVVLACPSDIIPVAGQISVNGTSLFGNMFIQGVSSVTATASGWSGTYGSTIRLVSLSGNGKKITFDPTGNVTTYASALTLNAGLLKASGQTSFVLTVTDSRGRTSSAVQAIDVEKYSPISIVSTAQGRLPGSGAGSLDSGYVKVEYTYTPLHYQSQATVLSNMPVLTISWNTGSEIVEDYASLTQHIFAENSLQKSIMYTISIHLSDGITSTTVTRTLSTAYAFMRWDPAQNAIGFGCYPSSDHCVEVAEDWELRASGYSVTDQLVKHNTRFEDNIYYMNKVQCIGDELTAGTYLYNGGYISAVTNYPFYLKRMAQADIDVSAAQGLSAADWYSTYADVHSYSEYDTVLLWLGMNGGLTDTLDNDAAASSYDDFASTNTGSYCKIIARIVKANPRIRIILGSVYYINGNDGTSVETTNRVIAKIAARYSSNVIGIVDISNPLLSGGPSAHLYHPFKHTDYDAVLFGKIGNLHLARHWATGFCSLVAEHESAWEVLVQDDAPQTDAILGSSYIGSSILS